MSGATAPHLFTVSVTVLGPVLVPALLAAGCAAGAVLLSGSARPRARPAPDPFGGPAPATADPGLLRRWCWAWSLLAGTGALVVVGGPAGPVAGLAAAAGAWLVIGRSEPPGERRARLAAEADLPALVLLLAAALRGGAPPATALGVCRAALPGGAADRLEPVQARLALGVDPVAVWESLVPDPVLAPLARTMSAAARSGASVADAIERLAVDLARTARARREDRARAVGVKAALPLGLCLLPAFLLIGVVPVVAGLLATITS